MSRALSVDDLESRRFFEALAPELAISDGVRFEPHRGPSPAWPASGHVELPGVVAADRIAPMAAAVEALVARGVPTVFAYVYDAFWEPAGTLLSYAETVLGPCKVVSDGWAWHVPPGPESSGWTVHRDTSAVQRRLTGWVALTDTDEDSACMYIVPLDRDPAYAAGRLEDQSVPDGAAIALPVKAGTGLVWDVHTLHWGGRSSARARGPRISFSYTFAPLRDDDHREELDLSRLPFTARLDAIAAMIVRYEHHVRMPPPVDSWARTLVGLRTVLARATSR
jgi:hypothetical protein